MSFIKRAWSGQERMVKVFWLYGVVGGIVVSIIAGIVSAMLGLGQTANIAIMLPYCVWLMVSEWRCAFNVDWKGWGYIVRVCVCISALGWLVIIGSLIMVSSMTPPAAAPATVAPEVSTMAPQTNLSATPGAAPVGALPSSVPMTASANSPTETVPATTAPTLQATPAAACEQKMKDYAVQQHADPIAYVAQNQAYLQQCIQSTPAPASAQ